MLLPSITKIRPSAGSSVTYSAAKLQLPAGAARSQVVVTQTVLIELVETAVRQLDLPRIVTDLGDVRVVENAGRLVERVLLAVDLEALDVDGADVELGLELTHPAFAAPDHRAQLGGLGVLVIPAHRHDDPIAGERVDVEGVGAGVGLRPELLSVVGIEGDRLVGTPGDHHRLVAVNGDEVLRAGGEVRIGGPALLTGVEIVGDDPGTLDAHQEAGQHRPVVGLRRRPTGLTGARVDQLEVLGVGVHEQDPLVRRACQHGLVLPQDLPVVPGERRHVGLLLVGADQCDARALAGAAQTCVGQGVVHPPPDLTVAVERDHVATLIVHEDEGIIDHRRAHRLVLDLVGPGLLGGLLHRLGEKLRSTDRAAHPEPGSRIRRAAGCPR